ncbi:MAG: hypothetical protein IJH63_10395 [Methanobrevibacter sp.]|nr:hypothetical protein [Methanosphaera sp.]MBR0371109.1 hypothetical protein [Methanobrevibacter sp.]
MVDKISVDDIVGIVKTDEVTNSVELKKEAQLNICEKRLIRLEKENAELREFKEDTIRLINSQIRFNNKKYLETRDTYFRDFTIDLNNLKRELGIEDYEVY